MVNQEEMMQRIKERFDFWQNPCKVTSFTHKDRLYIEVNSKFVLCSFLLQELAEINYYQLDPSYEDGYSLHLTFIF